MSTILMSPKGGNCTTVTAAAFAVVLAHRGVNTLLVDLCGDIPAVLGMSEPMSPGVNDWLGETRSSTAESLVMAGTPVIDNLVVVHRGARFVEGQPRWGDFASAIAVLPHTIIIDAGTTYIPDDVRATVADTVLVTKPCYLSLRRATQMPAVSRVFVVAEEGRALSTTDVSHVIGSPVAATIPHSPAISRAVDAGLLLERADDLFGRCFPEH